MLGALCLLALSPAPSLCICCCCSQELYLGAHPSFDEPWDVDLTCPWVLSILRSAPPSLRFLSLAGAWDQVVASAACGLTQLRALHLYLEEDKRFEWSGDVWGGLQALGWDVGAGAVGLPQVRAAGSLTAWY